MPLHFQKWVELLLYVKGRISYKVYVCVVMLIVSENLMRKNGMYMKKRKSRIYKEESRIFMIMLALTKIGVHLPCFFSFSFELR